jgi:hypothetical protein
VKNLNEGFTVAFTGAVEGVKEHLAEAVKRRLDAVLKRDMAIVRSDVEHQALDPAATVLGGLNVRTVFAIEGVYIEVDRALVGRPKIFCRSIVDRYATVRAHGLNMELHFERSFKKHIDEYGLLVYCPMDDSLYGPLFPKEERDFSLSDRVDREIRHLIREHNLPVQIVLGGLQERCDLVVQAVKLKMGLDW